MPTDAPVTSTNTSECRETPPDLLRISIGLHTDFDAMSSADAALIASIREFGILCPIIVGPERGGRHVIVDGCRRFEAARHLGLPAVPCAIGNASDEYGYAVQRFILNTTAKPWTQAERKAVLERLGLT